ncbi:GRP family sugar transporter [Enterococcus sp. AZ089]|uniref:GRP family sugar transporter n=1 Tax=Enterococcus sp. AZ089 TaxID=2774693 RepID=UPI003D2FC7F6
MMIFFYFLPAIGWGVMPLIAKLTRSKPINQLVGTTTAAVLVSLLFTFLIKPEFTNFSVMIAFVSGCFWAIGQYFQFYSFQFLPVSEAMPISNGTQLIGTTFVAAFFFQEWTNVSMWLIGSGGILLIVLGIWLTSWKEKQTLENQKRTNRKAIASLLLSSAALTVYVVLPQAFQVRGSGILFPQAIGMWSTSAAFVFFKQREIDWQQIRKNISTGIAWSMANISLFLMIPMLGVAKSFTFSQFAVLISMYGGLLVFKQKKKRKEFLLLSLGGACIIGGILLIGFIK